MRGGDGSIRYLSAVISEDNPTPRPMHRGAPGGRRLHRRKMKDGEGGRAERDGYTEYTRKDAIDLSQKEAAVSGLFFNELVENERGREKDREGEAPIEK